MSADTVKPPDTLYHYCGVEAFHGIIASKQLWLTSAAFTNDYMEYRWLIERAREYVAVAAKTSDYREVWNAIDGCLRTSRPPHIFCLSGGGDMLSQWRAYSDNGAGFSIGYSSQYLCDMLHAASKPEWKLALKEVMYDEEKQAAFVERRIGMMKKWQHNTADAAILIAVTDLAHHAAICKNHGFKEEDEWRIVLDIASILVRAKPEWKIAMTYHGNPFALTFRADRGRIISYCTLPFEPSGVTDLYLGPKNYAQDNHPLVKDFLAVSGYDVERIKIRSSDATYR